LIMFGFTGSTRAITTILPVVSMTNQ
jgi:hypothetical protein